MQLNPHYAELNESYLFSTIAHKVADYQKAHPEADVIRLGIGDVTLPLAASVTEAMHKAVEEQGHKGTFHGYIPSEQGYEFLRDAIRRYYAGHGVELDMSEIFISDGAKSDLGNLLDLFSQDNTILVPDPVYPVYVDDNVMAGRKILYLPATAENGFLPMPDEAPHADIVYICSPNNPTGALYPREVLQQIVDIAREPQLIIFSDEIYDRLVMDGLQHISIASMAPDLFCVTFSGLSKSHMIAGYRIGWMILSGNKRIAKDYIEGLNMLANMRMCSNVPAQSVVQTALGGHQSVNDYIVPGGRVHDQRDLVYDMLNQIPGITAVKPKAAFYIFPKIDVKRFNIHSDEQFALDLLHDKHILISHGGAFNWHRPDHFRVVYLPRMGMLRETMGEISDFFSYYWQS